VDERLSGTLAAVVASVLNGASAVRVHDVGEAKEAVAVADAVIRGAPAEAHN
jgi:dihydropteroate synthase